MPSNQVVDLTGIPSAESFGFLAPQAQTIELSSILSGEAVGQPVWNMRTSLVGIPFAHPFGHPRWNHTVSITGVPSGNVFGKSLAFTFKVPPEVPIERSLRQISVGEKFSGIIVNQNKAHTASFPLNIYSSSAYSYYQEFYLPKDYIRFNDDSTENIPPITGFQFLVAIHFGFKDTAALDWTLQRSENSQWVTLGTGTANGSPVNETESWFDVYSEAPIDLASDWINDKFRVGIRGRNPTHPFVKLFVNYSNGYAEIVDKRIKVSLRKGVPFHFLLNDVPSVLHRTAQDRVYYSTEFGISQIYGTTPNPLATTRAKAFESDGITPLTDEGVEVSLNFRVLAGTADDGTDFLGNQYRSAITRNTVANVSTKDSGTKDKFWLSKPNPSKFAIESLYFDVTDDSGRTSVVDRILVDPLTPGVYFNVYYTDEGNPVTHEDEWDEKLWSRVPLTFKMEKRETFALPQPITAKYIKLEFVQLQPRWYAAGEFPKPTLYKKHPKWVLDYFLLRLAAAQVSEDPYIGDNHFIQFNYYDLAYNYYLDDLGQEPNFPTQLGATNTNPVDQFLKERNDLSDSVDLTTQGLIQTSFAPYRTNLALRGKLNYLLSSRQFRYFDQSVERPPPPRQSSDQVSNIKREQVVIEKTTPAMFFYVPCRHNYRLVTANYLHDRAYFVGIQEIAFMRDHYAVAHDDIQYIETAGDLNNVERNDFVQTGDPVWVTYTNG